VFALTARAGFMTLPLQGKPYKVHDRTASLKRETDLMRFRVFVLLCAAYALASCATHNSPEAYQDPYGFFSGIWHGAIFFFSLAGVLLSWICSLVGLDILSDVQIIGRPNTGLSYYLGFALGLLTIGGSTSSNR
jgi:hypothetical protein